MKKNTLFHNKKDLKKNHNKSKQLEGLIELSFQNPQNSAKFCLLQISEEKQKINNHISNSPENFHCRSNSTEFFNSKNHLMNRQIRLQTPNNDKYESSRRIQHQKDKNMLKSVAFKSTFSNQMRKTYNDNKFYKTTYHSTLFDKGVKQEMKQGKRQTPKYERCQSRQQFRKTSYFPLNVNQQNKMEGMNEIFRTTPSKQIIAILQKTRPTKNLIQFSNQINLKQRHKDQVHLRKRMSIFNIRHAVLKQSINKQVQNNFFNKKTSLSPLSSFKRLSPCNLIGPILNQQVPYVNKNVIKLRLKNRVKSSAMSNNL